MCWEYKYVILSLWTTAPSSALLVVHIVTLRPALFANPFFTWRAAHTRVIHPIQLLFVCTWSFPVTLFAIIRTNLQINTLVSATVNCLGASAVVLHEVGDGALLTFVVDTCCEWIQAKETLVTFTRKGWWLPHPIWFGTIHVSPAVAYGIVHQISAQINLEPPPAMLNSHHPIHRCRQMMHFRRLRSSDSILQRHRGDKTSRRLIRDESFTGEFDGIMNCTPVEFSPHESCESGVLALSRPWRRRLDDGEMWVFAKKKMCRRLPKG